MERKKKQTYCLVCRDYTKRINPKIVRNRQNRYIIQSNCATCGSRKSRFIKEQKALGILSNLEIDAIKMMLSRCSICNNKKCTFVSQGSGWLDSLGLNTPQNRMKNALWNAFNR